MFNYQRIRRDCFWDANISNDALIAMSKSHDHQELQRLFEKILLNSTALFCDLQIFEPHVLKQLLEDYNVPRFNGAYAFRRKNMAEVFFFDKPLQIDELQWTA